MRSDLQDSQDKDHSTSFHIQQQVLLKDFTWFLYPRDIEKVTWLANTDLEINQTLSLSVARHIQNPKTQYKKQKALE